MTKSLPALLLACLLLLAGCGRTEKDPPETTKEPESVTTPDTAAAATDPPTDTTAPETAADTEPSPSGITAQQLAPFRIVSNDGGLDFHTLRPEATLWYTFPLEDDRTLFSLYDYSRNTDGPAAPQSIRLALFDNQSGTFTAQTALDGRIVPSSLSATEDGYMLSGFSYEKETMEYAAWHVTLADGAICAEAAEYDGIVTESLHTVSPDGKWTAFSRETDRMGHGGIFLRAEDGSVTQITENVMLNDSGTAGMVDVRGYTPVGFLDASRLVYNIGGWEWRVGYGIYDTATGERTEFENGMSVSFIRDGVLYGMEVGNYQVLSYRTLGEDGTSTVLASSELCPLPELSRAFTGEPYAVYNSGMLLLMPYEEDGTFKHVYIFSADLQSMLAQLEFTEDVRSIAWILSGTSVSLIWK